MQAERQKHLPFLLEWNSSVDVTSYQVNDRITVTGKQRIKNDESVRTVIIYLYAFFVLGLEEHPIHLYKVTARTPHSVL
jgi:hypothetical protein